MSYNNGFRIAATGLSWPSLQPGGLNTYFQSICEQLTLERNTLDALICSDEQPQAPDRIRIHTIGSKQQSIWKRRELMQKYAAELFDKQPMDILYSHFAPYSVGPALEAKKRGIPVVTTFHGPWTEEMKIEGQGIKHFLKTTLAKSIEMKAYGLSDKFIVLSETFRDILHEHYKVPLSKIHIIPGAANVERFHPAEDRGAVRERLNLPQNATIVLTVRRLVNRMGLLQLLEAWRRVTERHPDHLLLIGGKGPLMEELASKVAEYNLHNHVRLLGYVSDEELPLYHQASNLFVVPTQALEGFGLITVEAMASGLPVLATPVGGSKEILRGFRPELLFQGTDSEAIAEGLLRVLDHRELLPNARECRDHVLSRYTWGHVAEQVEEVFRQVLDRKAAAK
ncbi:glycosyltransferase family 4 protein [Paenibacillus sp. SEL3]|jgi:glycosyltransferase involved in cell wall biosynthesis|nr:MULTISPECIES: glycosyltransferase family 4 protein [Paenibacillus]KAF6576472.1 glycosyltransferase family 4 protein [Paenibacillus sp. EKM206P]KAF6591394.1 glycosyltransferase family 4 protein [Paenibacillus sp. EKM205P]KEO80151.1 glycosyl transferase [Paenibacillus polymyxa]MBM0632085.1 glycosyltransferase family 4 protein [Paenibacillus polymyxa]MBP1310245.1 glycosyltransferase involved in cell wall biosynthesis [Paenibacillus sp. 1182]